MHKRAFQGLKRTFLHVSGLPRHILINNHFMKYLVFFLSKYGGGRSDTCINVRFRAWNASLCMSQFLTNQISFKNIIKYLVYLNQNMVKEDLRHAKSAFQDLKLTFMHVSELPPPNFDLKNQVLHKMVFY